jgi:hypothetical protein
LTLVLPNHNKTKKEIEELKKNLEKTETDIKPLQYILNSLGKSGNSEKELKDEVS